MTTKSRKSTRFSCVQVACHILQERSRRELQLCFRPHINPRFTKIVMGPQSCGSPKSILSSPIPKLQHALYPSKVLQTKEHAPTPCSFAIFCLGLTFESLKGLSVRHPNTHFEQFLKCKMFVLNMFMNEKCKIFQSNE